MIKADILRDEMKFVYGAMKDLLNHIDVMEKRIKLLSKQLEEEEKK